MKTLYINPTAGIAGDMFVAALLALGADTDEFWTRLRSLPISADEWKARSEPTMKNGISATAFKVVLIDTHGHGHAADSGAFKPHKAAHTNVFSHTHQAHAHDHHHRHLPQILDILAETPGLSDRAREWAVGAFHELARAEARVHAVPPEKVHFHEVGAVDAIVDIAGACIALDLLGVDRIACGPVAVGGGTVKCDHGIMPVPAPATAFLLEGFETRFGPAEGELTTPTGAALLRALVDDRSGRLDGVIRAVGYGAGTKDFPNHANVLQCFLLDTAAAPRPAAPRDVPATDVVMIECTLDDLPGERLSHILPTLMAAGALDVAVIPCLMKKGRQGMLMQVMATADRRADLADLMLRHTSSFGVRWYAADRLVLDREIVDVDTPVGRVQVKLGRHPGTGELLRLAPEYESCRLAADAANRPISEVYDHAVAAATAAYRGA